MKHWIGPAALALALVGAPAYATTTFAQFEQIDNNDTISFSGGNTLAAHGATLVSFNFLDSMPAGLDGPITAFMTLSATGGPYMGALSFLRQSDNANLLTVTFTGALLSGMGSAASLIDADPGGVITFTSDFLDFTGTTAEDFALSFSALSAAFGGNAWTADATGTFAADTVQLPGGSPAPEPTAWAMMIIGFGGVGALLRRRRTGVAAFA